MIQKFHPLVILVCLLSASAHAIPEGSSYAEQYAKGVAPYYESAGVTGTLRTPDGINLSYRVFRAPNEKAALVILPGHQEPYAKYAEVVYDLRDLGYSIYLLDHRGQGFSDRMTSDREVSYVRHFSDYVNDLHQFVKEVVNAEPHSKRFLLAHSMGGAIAALFLKEYPGIFDAAALSSPMIEPLTAPYSEPIALDLSLAACVAGFGKHYALGYGPFDPSVPFEKSDVTQSRDRWTTYHDLQMSTPELIVGGASFRWAAEALSADRQIRGFAPLLVKTPLLVLEAGQDKIVHEDEEENFCKNASRCRSVFFSQSFHEILMERDFIRSAALDEIRGFFALQE